MYVYIYISIHMHRLACMEHVFFFKSHPPRLFDLMDAVSCKEIDGRRVNHTVDVAVVPRKPLENHRKTVSENHRKTILWMGHRNPKNHQFWMVETL